MNSGLKCLLNIPLEKLNRHLDMDMEFREEKQSKK